MSTINTITTNPIIPIPNNLEAGNLFAFVISYLNKSVDPATTTHHIFENDSFLLKVFAKNNHLFSPDERTPSWILKIKKENTHKYFWHCDPDTPGIASKKMAFGPCSVTFKNNVLQNDCMYILDGICYPFKTYIREYLKKYLPSHLHIFNFLHDFLQEEYKIDSWNPFLFHPEIHEKWVQNKIKKEHDKSYVLFDVDNKKVCISVYAPQGKQEITILENGQIEFKDKNLQEKFSLFNVKRIDGTVLTDVNLNISIDPNALEQVLLNRTESSVKKSEEKNTEILKKFQSSTTNNLNEFKSKYLLEKMKEINTSMEEVLAKLSMEMKEKIEDKSLTKEKSVLSQKEQIDSVISEIDRSYGLTNITSNTKQRHELIHSGIKLLLQEAEDPEKVQIRFVERIINDKLIPVSGEANNEIVVYRTSDKVGLYFGLYKDNKNINTIGHKYFYVDINKTGETIPSCKSIVSNNNNIGNKLHYDVKQKFFEQVAKEKTPDKLKTIISSFLNFRDSKIEDLKINYLSESQRVLPQVSKFIPPGEFCAYVLDNKFFHLVHYSGIEILKYDLTASKITYLNPEAKISSKALDHFIKNEFKTSTNIFTYYNISYILGTNYPKNEQRINFLLQLYQNYDPVRGNISNMFLKNLNSVFLHEFRLNAGDVPINNSLFNQNISVEFTDGGKFAVVSNNGVAKYKIDTDNGLTKNLVLPRILTNSDLVMMETVALENSCKNVSSTTFRHEYLMEKCSDQQKRSVELVVKGLKEKLGDQNIPVFYVESDNVVCYENIKNAILVSVPKEPTTQTVQVWFSDKKLSQINNENFSTRFSISTKGYILDSLLNENKYFNFFGIPQQKVLLKDWMYKNLSNSNLVDSFHSVKNQEFFDFYMKTLDWFRTSQGCEIICFQPESLGELREKEIKVSRLENMIVIQSSKYRFAYDTHKDSVEFEILDRSYKRFNFQLKDFNFAGLINSARKIKTPSETDSLDSKETAVKIEPTEEKKVTTPIRNQYYDFIPLTIGSTSATRISYNFPFAPFTTDVAGFSNIGKSELKLVDNTKEKKEEEKEIMPPTEKSTLQNVKETIISDAKKAGPRVVANKVTKTVQQLLVEGIASKMGYKGKQKDTFVSKFTDLLATPGGNAVISEFIGMMLPLLKDKLPEKYQNSVDVLAEEFRVRGIAILQEELIDAVLPVFSMMSNVLMESLSSISSAEEENTTPLIRATIAEPATGTPLVDSEDHHHHQSAAASHKAAKAKH